MENNQEKSQEEMVKEAVEEAKKAAGAEGDPQDENGDPEETTAETAAEAEEAEEADQEPGQESSEASDDGEKKEKKFFGKKKKDKKDEKIEELTDKLTRQMAEFDNFRKRTEKENAFVQGMEKVYKQLMTTLEGIEVKPIEAVGKEFDPNFHNAVMHVEDENLGENIVAEEFQKGYMYRDSVVRHSMVKVAN